MKFESASRSKPLRLSRFMISLTLGSTRSLATWSASPPSFGHIFLRRREDQRVPREDQRVPKEDQEVPKKDQKVPKEDQEVPREDLEVLREDQYFGFRIP